jgi:hypothetical protein
MSRTVDITNRGGLVSFGLTAITDAIESGALSVPTATYPVERVRGAAAVLAAGHVHGKVVITR